MDEKNGQPRGEPPPKRRRFGHFPDVVEVIQRQCCMDKCMRTLSLKDIEQCQAAMQSLNENEQFNFVMKQVNDHTIIKNHSKNVLDNIYNLVISGKSVCRIAWCHAYNISDSRFRSVLQELKDGYLHHEHGNKGKYRTSVKTTNATGWMKHTFDRIGKIKLELLHAAKYGLVLYVVFLMPALL